MGREGEGERRGRRGEEGESEERVMEEGGRGSTERRKKQKRG